MDTAGPALLVGVIAVLNAALGVGMGLFCSAFARTEFQAVQLLPIVVIPQILLCGLFVARADMVDWLRYVSNVLPLSYAVEALQQVGAHADADGRALAGSRGGRRMCDPGSDPGGGHLAPQDRLTGPAERITTQHHHVQRHPRTDR